jgi:NAD-dependent deacetylase
MIEKAAMLCSNADVFVLIGTSLAVYPAAGLIDFVPQNTPKYIIDPKIPPISGLSNLIKIPLSATEGVNKLSNYLD